MLSTALRLVGTDLSRQFERLRFALEDFKNRTADDLKQKAIGAGVTIGLAFAGMLFALLTVFAGLAALYLYVDYERGPLVALGAVALITAALAILLFALAALRGRRDAPVPLRPMPAPQVSVTQNLTDRTAAVANEALDSTADMLRRSSRETILAAMGAAIIAGVVIGRRRFRP